ncbi:MAG: alpha-2-macroglobulin family protein [Candidatus Moraniibacteriota bacterium]
MKSKFFLKLLGGLFVSLFFLSGVLFFGNNFIKNFFGKDVSGSELRQELFFSGEENYYGRGGLFSFTSKNEPVIILGAHDIDGDATVDIYRVDISDALRSFVYDKEGKQLNILSDYGKFKKVASFSQYVFPGNDRNSGARITLPIEESGVWLVRASLNGVEAKAFVVRSDIGTLVKEGDNKMIFWTQDIADKKSLSRATIKVYNLEGEVKKRYQEESNDDGIAETPISSKDDVAVVEKNGEIALVPINFKNINSNYSYKAFVEKVDSQNIFTFTDRPLYTPGDKVYFKSIIREDDDARYSIKESNVEVEVFSGWGEERVIVDKKKYDISPEGTISGEFELAKDLKNGSYTLGIVNDKKQPSSDAYPMGRYYSDYLSQINFNVEYYQKPEYEIDVLMERDDIISGDDLSFLVEGNYFSGQPISGQEFEYRIYSSDFYEYAYHREIADYGFSNNFRYGYRGSNLVNEGKATLDEKGQFKVSVDSTIPDDEKRKSQIFSIEVELKDASGNQSFERKNVLVRAGEFGIYRDDKNYTYGTKIGEEISLPVVLTPKTSNKELTGKIVRTWWDKEWRADGKYPHYNRKEETYSSVSATTNSQGEATLHFSPELEGSYTMTVEGFDGRGNRVTKDFSFWVSDSDGYYSGNGMEQGLTIKANKDEYTPTDKVELTIYSEIPDRDIFFSIERGRTDRYRIIHINGHREVVELPLVENDLPNVFASVSSFSESRMESAMETINLSTESKRIKILLTPDKAKYDPGDTASIKIKTTDYKNNPIAVEAAVWLVDKALFELMDSSTKDVFKQFWRERYNDTQSANSLMGISGELAEKGGGGGGGREIFKDTAYWNANVHTDENGYAKISFKLPDNLTTWVLSGIGSNRNTMVGQTTNEIKVSKDIIIRPVLPNILRVNDDVDIAAVIQNFTDKDGSFEVKMEFDSGEVKNEDQKVELKSMESKQVYWKVRPDKENENSKVKFSLLGKNSKNSDIVTKNLPIRKAGFWEMRSEVGGEKSAYEINLSPDVDLEKTQISLSLYSTMLGRLPSSMKYLIGYPYGCVEQTTSRFVPTVISKENPELLKDSIGKNDLDEFMRIGVERLTAMQGDDGGWGWWGGVSEYFISSYVTEYLLRAKAVGANVDDKVLSRAKEYFQQEFTLSRTDKKFHDLIIIQAYTLSLFGEKRLIEDFNQEISPDILALAVISNVRNGFTDPNKNGRDKLISMAKKEGEGSLFWEEGSIDRFGSADASTGLALRAFVVAGGDKDTASKAVRFLTEKKNRNYWSNTFATVQVAHGLIEFSRIEKELFPNLQYVVKLDGVKVANGSFNDKNWEDEIILETKQMKSKPKQLSIEKIGDGSLYSEILLKEFRFDDNAKAQSNGINITRNYVNEKGKNYSIGVGDIVNVEISINGDFSNGSFAVIEDQLPAGMIPINPVFKNSQKNKEDKSFTSNFKEMTENKVIFANNFYDSKNKNFRYKARVVSEGEFQVPPVSASLMYSPDVNGHSSTQKIKIVKKSEKLFDFPSRFFKKPTSIKNLTNLAKEIDPAKVLAGIFLMISFITTGVVCYKKIKEKK